MIIRYLDPQGMHSRLGIWALAFHASSGLGPRVDGMGDSVG